MSVTAALAFTSHARRGSAADDIDSNDAMCRMQSGRNSSSTRATLPPSVTSICRQLPSYPSGAGARSTANVVFPLLPSSAMSWRARLPAAPVTR